jgi:hypothetical protein
VVQGTDLKRCLHLPEGALVDLYHHGRLLSPDLV